MCGRFVATSVAAACLTVWLAGCGLENELAGLLNALTGTVRDFDGDDFGRRDDDDFGRSDDDFGRSDDDDFGKVELKGFLSGAGSLRAEVEYEDEPGETKFEVEVFGGERGAVLDIAINDTVVASITLNQFGTSKLEFTTRPHEFDHQPLPAGFPTLVAGDVVSVGGMSGALYRDD